MRLLFWNIHKNDVTDIALAGMIQHDVDVAVFAEFENCDLDSLGSASAGRYTTLELLGCDKVRFVIKSGLAIGARFEQTRHSILSVVCNGEPYLVAGLHLRDRRNYGKIARVDAGAAVTAHLYEVADGIGCSNIVVIGDFNANPYDPELLCPKSFNAILFKDVIKKSESCKYLGRGFRRLYNPVLDFISEDTRTYGSYYRSGAEDANPYWHCLDQVLVSSRLVDRVTSLQYPREFGGVTLVKKVQPDKAISDHLPLLVEISDGSTGDA